jgi:rhomboid protease GluP
MKKNPDVKTSSLRLIIGKPFFYPATTTILVILIGHFVMEIVFNAFSNDAFLLRLGAISDSGDLRGQYWRLFTYSLLHSGYAHLIMNSSLLWWTGTIVERRIKGISMICIYVLSVLSGGLLVTYWKSLHPTLGVTIGASAGIIGLLAAALVLTYHPAMQDFEHSNRLRVALWLTLVAGIVISLIPGVSFAGHLGGLICGALLGYTFPFLITKR